MGERGQLLGDRHQAQPRARRHAGVGRAGVGLFSSSGFLNNRDSTGDP